MSTDRRRGLGRGLGALIPSFPQEGAARDATDVFFGGSATAEPVEEEPAEAPPRSTWNSAHARPVETVGSTGNTGAQAGASSPTVEHGDPLGAGPDGEPEAAAPAGGTPDQTGGDEDGLRPVPGARFAEVPFGRIRPNPRQPRQVFDEDELAELVHSVREIGILQPIVVRPVAGEDGETYELVMGERRWRAAQAAGLATVPAIVRRTEDEDLLRDALLENLHRAQLNPLEEAAAYSQLLEDFGCTHEVLAERIGRSRPQISNTLRLMKLPPLVQRRVAAGVLSAGHARALLGLPDGAAMERMAQRIVAEGLSVRTVEELVALGEGEQDAPRRAGRAVAGHHPELEDLAGRLSDRLDTRVSIRMGKHRGRLTVDFSSAEDLDRILDAWQGADQQR